MAKDPVCNMDVKQDEAISAQCDGQIFYFCSEGCKEKFLKERECKLPRTIYDLIIVGGGPAGMTAAVYSSTLKIEALLIAKDLGGQAIDSAKIENYMGFDFITGSELIEKFRHQLIHSRYIDHQMTEVEKVEIAESGFYVTTSELQKYSAKTLIFATGMTRRRLNVAGEEEFQRKGIFYGNIQDLSFITGEDVAVIGGGNSAFQMVETLHTVAKNIHLVSDSEFTADPVIIDRARQFANFVAYEDYKVLEFFGEGALSGISVRKKAEEGIVKIPLKGVFVAIGLQPNSELVSHLVKLNEKREIVINSDCSTNHAGLFAAGDVTNVFGKRIVIASGEGAKAALSARQYLLNLKKSLR